MNSSDRESKRARLKQFLKKLSEDPALLHAGPKEMRPLSELLIVSGYRLSDDKIDMAELVSIVLRKMGLASGTDELMEHILTGGKVEDFMKNIPRHGIKKY